MHGHDLRHWIDPRRDHQPLMDPAHAVRVTDAFGDTVVARATGVQLLTA